MSETVKYTDSDVALAVELVTRSFLEELVNRLSPVEFLEVTTAVYRRMEERLNE